MLSLFLFIVVPLEISTVFKAYPWRLGEFGCDMATMACELTTHVLILTMIAFSIERYKYLLINEMCTLKYDLFFLYSCNQRFIYFNISGTLRFAIR